MYNYTEFFLKLTKKNCLKMFVLQDIIPPKKQKDVNQITSSFQEITINILFYSLHNTISLKK